MQKYMFLAIIGEKISKIVDGCCEDGCSLFGKNS